MFFAHKRTKQGLRSQFCKNNNKKYQTVLAYENHNILANSHIQLMENFLRTKEEFAPTEVPMVHKTSNNQLEEKESNLNIPRVDVQSKYFKVAAGENGYSRVVKITEIVIGDKILRLSDMFTVLPKQVNDALSSMIECSSENQTETQALSIYFNKAEIPAGVLHQLDDDARGCTNSEEEKKIVEENDNQGGNSHQVSFFTLAGTPDSGPIQGKGQSGKKAEVLEEEDEPGARKYGAFKVLQKKISKGSKPSNSRNQGHL